MPPGQPRLHLTTVNLNAPDAGALARFYARLLGWEIATEEPDWAVVRPPGDGVALSFQTEPLYRRPTWPAETDRQQMMIHLEFRVDDLDRALAHAVGCGAAVADHQPQDDVRVCLDPDGHPFCLWIET
ncbi:MAG: hypothetical protein QOG49_1395 [Frankiaceae bacterium]|nr:hypothetical protein [Frankiaceae bacterium]